MGWNLLRSNILKKLSRHVLAAGLLALVGAGAQAQFGGQPPIVIQNSPATIDDLYQTVSNPYLVVGVGVNKNVCGAIGIVTTPGNPTDPNNVLMEGWNLQSLVPKETEPPWAPYKGGWVYVRVDGGALKGGQDYIWGDINKYGQWLIAPTVVGNRLQARWKTVLATTGTGGLAAANPNIEVDLTVSFIHNNVRFAFDIKNTNVGISHTVGLAFVQDISASATTFFLDGPLRLPNQPYLHHEVMLPGALVPNKWETFSLIRAASGQQEAQVHSLVGRLKPISSGQTEPTPPTRFLYGRVGDFVNIAGADLSTGTKVRNLDITWNFEQYVDPNRFFDKPGIQTTDAGDVVYWDPVVVVPGATKTYVTFLGQDTGEWDNVYPMSLAVDAPKSLDFVTDRTNPNKPVAGVAPNPFRVSGFVQNLTDQSQNQLNSIGPISLFINLPPGLILAAGETANKTISDSAPGVEAGTSWQVTVDPKNPRSGPLIISVSAKAKTGPGKVVQVTVEVPAPPTVVLKSNKITGGLFEMKSFPLNFAGKTPSEVLGLPIPNPGNGVTQQVDVLQWDPTAAHYVSVNTWVPGYAYWIRYNPLDTNITTNLFPIDAAAYPPLDGSVQPNASSYRISYPKGWNQIADPYVYAYRFSELQVFDNDSLQLVDIITAADNAHNWMLPAVYKYDSSDPSTANWRYTLLDNFGFQMMSGEGYWIRVNKDNLQFIYSGTDTPGGSVSRAALLGVGMGSSVGRGTDTNWRLNLNARGASSMDQLTYIGVAPKATDQPDNFKYAKPPAMNASISLDIVHQDWGGSANGRYAQDLRSPGPAVKTWNMVLTSPKPNEEVTLTWPDIAASVPRTYKLTLIDMDTNDHRDLRGTSSYVVNTGAAATRHIQIVAQPTPRRGSAVITSFDVVNNTTRVAGTPASVTIAYAVSSAAETRVYVRDSHGRTVRTLNATTRAASDGSVTGQTLWDSKDQQGVSLPSGIYQVELVALGADGQRSRQVKPVVMTR